MKEKKNIAITLQEAKEWYKGDNLALRELALKVFTKEELEKQELPKTWEEFCEKNPIKSGECLISPVCKIRITEAMGTDRNANEDKNLCTSKQEAEAFLALMQLRQLRKAYVKDWEPDRNNINKACIMHNGTDFIIAYYNNLCSRPLSFPTSELAEQFLTNFKDLLEIAKPLI